MATFLLLLDLLGTFVFALSGAMLAVRHRLDLFGVLVLACAAAVSGGIVRDVLIGATPPAALTHARYLVVACAAGLAGFRWHALVERLRNPVQILDAAGLALFAASGTGKALDYGLGPLSATLLGMLSGIGGGIARDLLVARTPVVLQAELYAVAALAGGGLVALGRLAGVPDPWPLAAGAAACFGLRFMAIRHGWQLPVARPPGP
ncbi:trimeric intracellular cation channel family protein [Vulcaniibacterium tengchongense]|uniref:Putative membrane protein YeiH n=1 Tax=Vulcaniibacterium tengchongense TaxID=1273429 RepID=A0A3N4VA38_9GAMM|nr:trimeric intracellular cation channel family protein [Vulcaniibacterium tengchongense]RPE79852.1 putative membrane protein YeiH [Vulcaniibacterium tengchongense]